MNKRLRLGLGLRKESVAIFSADKLRSRETPASITQEIDSEKKVYATFIHVYNTINAQFNRYEEDVKNELKVKYPHSYHQDINE